MKRRQLIKDLALFPLAAGAVGTALPLHSAAGEHAGVTDQPELKNIYHRLGVRPVINGRGTITIIGGCRMLPEVEQAMQEATMDYVEIDELMDAVGKRLGELTGTEAGLVSTGATGAL